MYPGTSVGFQKFYRDTTKQFGRSTFADYKSTTPLSGEIVIKYVCYPSSLIVPFVLASPITMFCSTYYFRMERKRVDWLAMFFALIVLLV